MSRTYRRKNYHLTRNTSWDDYTKAWGRHTEYGMVSHKTDLTRYGVYWEYREKTKEEKIYSYLWMHTDKSRYDTKSPKRWYRKEQRVKEKTNYKRQLMRWEQNPDYEIIEQYRMALDSWGWY